MVIHPNAWPKRSRIFGNAAHGTISHVSPMAAALFGKKVGKMAVVNGKQWEIVELGV